MSNLHYKQGKIVFQYETPCPSCGFVDTTLLNSRFRYCYACGVTFDKDNNRILSEKSNYKTPDYRSIMRVGAIFLLNNKTYYVTSRVDYSNSFREYYKEEGETGFSDESWQGTTWFLKTLEGEEIYLTEDFTYGSFIGRRLPELDGKLSAADFFSDNSYIPFEDKKLRVTEYGYSTVTFFEGESDDPLTNNTETRFISAKTNDGRNFVVEEGETWSECYIEEPITFDYIYNALKNNPEVGQVEKAMATNKIYYSLFWWVFIAMTGFWIYSLIASGDVHTAISLNLNEMTIDEDDGWLSPPIKITDLNKVYEMQIDALYSPTSPNNGYFAVFELLNKDTATINGFQSDLWVESGRDYEGNWRESQAAFYENFKFEEEGTYFVRIFIEQDSVYKTQYQGTDKLKGHLPFVKFTLYEGALASRFIFFGIVAWVILGIFGLVMLDKFK